MEVVKKYSALLITMLCVACAQDPISDCFIRPGERVKEELPHDNFYHIVLEQDISLEIVSGAVEKLWVEADENALGSLSINKRGDSLFCSNEISCKWSRPISRPKLIWQTDTLRSIIQKGNGTIYAADTIRTELLSLISYQGAGDFVISFEGKNLYLSNNDQANFILSGKCEFLRSAAFFNDGRIEAHELIADRIQLIQRGYNDMHLKATKLLYGVIQNPGNVYLPKRPDSVSVEISRGGKLFIDE